MSRRGGDLMNLFIPLQVGLELKKKSIANQAKQTWNGYVREHNRWLQIMCDPNLDENVREYVVKYCTDHPKFNYQNETPEVIRMIFKDFPSYNKGLSYYPMGYNPCTKKKDITNRGLALLRVLYRIKLLEYDKILCYDAENGIRTDSYLPYTGVDYRQTMHEFFQWYDRQLWDTPIGYKMMFLSDTFAYCSPEQKASVCIPVSEMKTWDRGIYFWHTNRHVAGLITKPNYK